MRLIKNERLSAVAAAKVESSGLTVEQALALGMYSVENAATLHSMFDAVPALVLPYFNAQRAPMRAGKDWPHFYRVRYLGEAYSFKDVAGKKQRYMQPPGTGTCAYLPLSQNWARIMEDPNEAVLITEGELKAAKACEHGFPTIGLGGVHNFQSKRTAVFFLPELEAFKWARRKVSIVYDSDYVEKPDICAAINALAEELEARGANVELASLPGVYDDGRKTGLDDFLATRDDDELVKVLHQSEPLTVVSTLWAMNEELVYVRNPGIVLAPDMELKLPPTQFTGHSDWSTLSTPERKVTSAGSVSYAKVSAASAWLSWPLRKAVNKITYKPGQERYVGGDYNAWCGWGCEPKKGDITPWRDLLKFIFEGAEPAFVEWFLDWCAYPLQYPGTKLFSAMVVYGDTTGTGKTLIGYTLGKIYGANFTKLTNDDLKRDFNGWAENKQFILGDEISGSDKRAESDALKTVITQEEITINIKLLPTFTIPDVINYYFTSNHADAFFVEDKDRRYAIHEVLQELPLPEVFYLEYDKWKNGDGPSHLFHYLLSRDLSKFNPKGPAYKTAARDRMAMHGKSDVGVWVRELAENPAQKLRLGQMRYARDLFTSAELLGMYATENDAQGKVTANGLGRALAAAGFKLAYNGAPILVNGKQGRYFIVRNRGHWLRVKNTKELARHIAAPLVREN